jgi:hypothetical protein
MPQDASAGRAQPPTDQSAPIALRLERLREDLEFALARLSDPAARLEHSL